MRSDNNMFVANYASTMTRGARQFSTISVLTLVTGDSRFVVDTGKIVS